MAISRYQISIKGISIIEILIVIAIVSIAFVALLGLASFSLSISISSKNTNQANSLAQEAIEIIRSFRDGTTWDTNGLRNLVVGVAYYPKKSAENPPKWTLIQGTETVDSFTREVVFEKVSRDPATDDIEGIYNPINDDSDTRKIIVTVFWEDKDVEIITYLTNWKQ